MTAVVIDASAGVELVADTDAEPPAVAQRGHQLAVARRQPLRVDGGHARDTFLGVEAHRVALRVS